MICHRTVIFILMCLIPIPANVYGDNTNRSVTDKFDRNRIKRQNQDRWIWGYVDVTTETNSDITQAATDSTGDNPCNRELPEKPDFRAAGRRISDESFAYMRENSNPKYPLFAIGGRPALPGEFPHMGAIGWQAVQGTWIFKCGSSLISTKFVLTAAHCTRISLHRDTTIADPVPKIVRLGDKNIIDVFSNGLSPQDAKIIRIITHPEYQSPKKYFDIALVELEFHLTFTPNVQPACLWNDFDTSPLGTQATVTGWGVVETAGRTTSPDLQASVVDVIDSKTCDQLLQTYCTRLWCGIQDSQICAGKLAGGVDACWGDSGGPLQIKINLTSSSQGAMHYVIGVTSFGFGCALKNTPGVYTRVSHFLDWIESIVWK